MIKNSTYKYHIAALFTVAVWGATFVSTKVLIANSLTPAEIFLLRFALAYVCIWPFAGRRIWAGSWRDELTLALAGVMGGSLYFLAENVALEYAPASNVSLIVCTAPVWTALLLSCLYRNERMSGRQIAGSAMAFAGMVLVVLNGHFVLHLSPKGDLLALAAALMWMVYSLVIKRLGGRYPAIFITRKVFFYGLLTILPVFFFRPMQLDPTILARPAVWGNLLFLGVVASMLCYVLWNAAMHKLGAVRTTNYIYINPLVTIVTAAVCIGEQVTPAALAGAALILLGMWMAERSKTRVSCE
ncbi:DMT family transporter [uncultured Alistipes sp.]|uniref:DMT family transporter n=1 Tax=uncultured Alistipes sp. TaxID=538949 RepID=UPI0025FFC1CC|nr:DMT family transporter [uncultured Alistipes sp.]